MVVSENVMKWALRFYPPMLFQRIWVISFDKGFRGVRVKVNKSLLNSNYNNSIFGGTLFAAADPFYPILFHQIFTHKGFKLRVWMKSAHIESIKPGRMDLFFDIRIDEAVISEIERVLNRNEKHIKAYPINMYDREGELCVSVMAEIYIRSLYPSEIKDTIAI